MTITTMTKNYDTIRYDTIHTLYLYLVLSNPIRKMEKTDLKDGRKERRMEWMRIDFVSIWGWCETIYSNLGLVRIYIQYIHTCGFLMKNRRRNSFHPLVSINSNEWENTKSPTPCHALLPSPPIGAPTLKAVHTYPITPDSPSRVVEVGRREGAVRLLPC